jgi:hypothetical protein
MNSTIFTSAIVKIILFIYYGDRHNRIMFFCDDRLVRKWGKAFPDFCPIPLQTHAQKRPRSRIWSNQPPTAKILNLCPIWNLAKSNTQSEKVATTGDRFTQKKIEFDTVTPPLILLFIKVVGRFLPRRRSTSSFASTSNQDYPKYLLFWTSFHWRNSNQG